MISLNFQKLSQVQESSIPTWFRQASISLSAAVSIQSVSHFSNRHAASCIRSSAGCYGVNLLWTTASIWFSKLLRSLSELAIVAQRRKNTVKVIDRGSSTASAAYRQKAKLQSRIEPSKGTILSVINGVESNAN